MKRSRNRIESVRKPEQAEIQTRTEIEPIEPIRIETPRPDQKKITAGGPVVVEISAQCWNCGSIQSAPISATSNGRTITRVRECQKCETVYETREVLRYGATGGVVFLRDGS